MKHVEVKMSDPGRHVDLELGLQDPKGPEGKC